MIEPLIDIAAATRLAIPADHRRPVAVVGAGAIVDLAHLPAYAQGGIEVVGVFDLDRAKAGDVAERHGIEHVFGSLEELLTDDRVEVVDVAVTPDAQPDIAKRAMRAGRHVLSQKPVALDPWVAEELASTAKETGRKMAVNQQLRFSESVAAAKAMIDAGWIGAITNVRVDVDISTDWGAWPWFATAERLDLQNHSIHYLDVVRFLVGDPDRVFCRGTRRPGAATLGETRTTSIMIYPGEVQGAVLVNHDNQSSDPWARFRIDGIDGAIEGTLGLLLAYPVGRIDTLRVHSRALPTDGWLEYPITTRWLPDAFLGPMASLLHAIATDTEPATSVADNIGTIRLVDALYRSMASRQTEPLEPTMEM